MSLSAARRADAKGNKIISSALKTGPLATGANQAAVKWAERMLQIAGFDPGVRDNKFTPKTAEAFKQFQAARGIPATGELDARTFAHLKTVEKFVRGHGKTFSVGQKDAFIQSAESRLKKLGYDTGKADGIFDRQTAKAMEGFKRDQKDLGKNSMLGKSSSKALARESNALAHDPTRGRKTEGLKSHRRLDAATAQAAARERPTGAGFGVGDEGRAVKNAQAHLRAAGFDPKRTDGKFDERTEGALRAFQRRSGLEPTGRVDQKTWAKLNGAVMLAKDATSPVQKLGERSAAVKRTEKLLKGAGYKVKVDGLFDANTERAVARFKHAHHVKGDQRAVGEGSLRLLKKLNAKGVTGPAPKNPKLRLVREIALMAKKYGIPAELPIITALTESNFSNPSGGDRDSVGMFQQRDAWGSYAERHDPIRSAKLFFLGGHGGQRGAVDFKKQFLKAGPAAYGRWAQAVQVSAYPDRYQTRVAEARRLLRAANVKLGTKM